VNIFCESSRDDRIVFFFLSDPTLFLKNDIRPESCFGWNHTNRIRKLSKNVLWCTTYIFVLCLFCLMLYVAKYLLELFCF